MADDSLTIIDNRTGDEYTVPIADGRLALGTWQGIYLCEHRDSGGPRQVVVTAWGEERARR